MTESLTLKHVGGIGGRAYGTPYTPLFWDENSKQLVEILLPDDPRLVKAANELSKKDDLQKRKAKYLNLKMNKKARAKKRGFK